MLRAEKCFNSNITSTYKIINRKPAMRFTMAMKGRPHTFVNVGIGMEFGKPR